LCARMEADLVWGDEERQAAILWSQQKGDASGRIACQFATHWVGKRLLAGKT